MGNLIDLSLCDLVNKVKSKEISSKEITSAYIDRSKKSKKLNTYVEETFDSALKSSEKFDEKAQNTVLEVSSFNNFDVFIFLGVRWFRIWPSR